ncbi:hypothetical protein GHT06_013102 [Daphnia sinensis]|uniref:RING-type domain-containing protein n=1 Tax=Daphnia sinensis TaxID=1820382 RepID=A0AAD5KXB0_9CRUS|nr:hypothetical protein GHT06_013102 [Daphnia sinensis]
MRAQCSVCQELFGDSDVVMAPQCGHTFHSTCITQWLGTKKSCPTCRQTTSVDKLVRIFFDIAFTADIDSADLQQKMDEMSLEFQVVQRELREVRQENVTLKKKSNKYCKEKKEAAEKVRDSEIVINNLQQRVEFLNKQVKNFGIVEDELKTCKEKLKLMENVQQIVNSTHEEVQEMLEQYGDHSETARSLSTQCVILSRELNAKVLLKQKAEEDLRKCRRLLSTFRVELQQTKKELKEKEEQSCLAEEDIKRYTTENSKLQEKLKALTESISSPSGDPRNSALSRLLNESPAPINLRMSNLLAATPATPSTPLVPLRVKGANVPSSRLILSSQNVSNMQPKLSNPEQEQATGSSERKEGRKADSLSAPVDPESLKFKRMKVDPVPSTSGYFYDGFGGHSKPDIYPRGASSSSFSATAKKKRGPVTMKIKGKTQTTTLDYFYSQ